MEIAYIREYEKGLFEALDATADGAAAMKAIRETGNLEGEGEEALKRALSTYTDEFVKLRV